MTKTTEPAVEIDFDSWLNGGERKAHFVTLYARADLIADIEELEKKRVVGTVVREEDASLAGEESPNAGLDEQINTLYLQLDASKKEFRVTSRTAPEVEAIREQVLVDFKDAADSAAAKARTAAKELAKRMGITAVVDINNLIRAKALEASNTVIDREVSIQAIAASTTMRSGDGWETLSAEQIRRLYSVIGESQVDALNRAFSRAAHEAPVVTVPKS